MVNRIACHVDFASSANKPFGVGDGDLGPGAALRACNIAFKAMKESGASHLLLDVGKIDPMARDGKPSGQFEGMDLVALEALGIPFGYEIWDAVRMLTSLWPTYFYVPGMAGKPMALVRYFYQRAQGAGIMGIVQDASGIYRVSKPIGAPGDKSHAPVGVPMMLALKDEFPQVESLVEGAAATDADGDHLLELGAVQTASGGNGSVWGTEGRRITGLERLRQHKGTKFCTLDCWGRPERIDPSWAGQSFAKYGPRWMRQVYAADAIPVVGFADTKGPLAPNGILKLGQIAETLAATAVK